MQTRGGELARRRATHPGHCSAHQHGAHSDGQDGHHRRTQKRDNSPKGDCMMLQDVVTPHVVDLLDLVYRLLGLHEVRLAIQLLEDWSTLPFAASALSVTPQELHFCIESFVRQQWSGRSSGGEAGLAMLQEVGSRFYYSEEEPAAKPASTKLHTLEKQSAAVPKRAVADSNPERVAKGTATEEVPRRCSTEKLATWPPMKSAEKSHLLAGDSLGDEVASRSSAQKLVKIAEQKPLAELSDVKLPSTSATLEALPPLSDVRSKEPSTAATLEAAGELLHEMLHHRAGAVDFERQASFSSSGDQSPRSDQAFPWANTMQVTPSVMSSPLPPSQMQPEEAPHVLSPRAELREQQASSISRDLGHLQGPLIRGSAPESETTQNGSTLPGNPHGYGSLPSSISNGSGNGFSGLALPLHKESVRGTTTGHVINQGAEYANVMMVSQTSPQHGSTNMHSSSAAHSCHVSTAPAANKSSSSLEDSVKEVIASCHWSLQPALTRAFKADEMHKSNGNVDDLWMGVPSHRMLINPNGPFRMSWDVVVLILILYESIAVPFSIAFDVKPTDWLQWLLTVFFATDCFLNLITGYFMDGTLVMKQKLIARHYTRTWMFLDLAATFPWFALNASGKIWRWLKVGHFLRMLRLLRLAKLHRLMQQIEDICYVVELIFVLRFLKIICMITLFCHWSACVWAWLGGPDHFDNSSQPHDRADCEPGGPCERGVTGSPWRQRYGLEGETVVFQYLVSLRFATGLFTGSDIGIQPGRGAERLFVILTMLMSFMALSSAISWLVVMFNKINQDHADQEDALRSFQDFMAASRVPLSLQSKLKRYLEYQFRVRRDLRVRHVELLEKLSPWLRTELQAHVNKPILIQHPFFRSLPRDLLAQCCCMAEVILAAPSDIVIGKGQVCQSMYFLVRGKLCINSDVEGHAASQQQREMLFRTSNNAEQSKNSQGMVMRSPGFVGASCLFGERPLNYTVSAATHSELLKLSKEDVDALREDSPVFRNATETFSRQQASSREGLVDCSLRFGNEQGGDWVLW